MLIFLVCPVSCPGWPLDQLRTLRSGRNASVVKTESLSTPGKGLFLSPTDLMYPKLTVLSSSNEIQVGKPSPPVESMKKKTHSPCICHESRAPVSTLVIFASSSTGDGRTMSDLPYLYVPTVHFTMHIFQSKFSCK